MITSNSILFTIICVCGFQAIILSILNFLKKPKSLAQKFLAMLIFFYAIMALNIVLVNVLKDFDILYVFRYVQLEMLYGIGPALYFYTKSITQPSFKFSRKNLWHFFPLVIEFIFYRTAWYRNGADGLYLDTTPNITYVYLTQQWIGVISIIVYSIIALRILYKDQEKLKQYYSKIENYSYRWLQLPIIIYASFFIVYNIISEIDRFVFERILREYYFLPSFVILAVINCWIGFKGYVLKERLDFPLPSISESTEDKTLDRDEVFLSKINTLMETQKPYLNPELNLSMLAELLAMKPKQVSSKLNQSSAMNFYDFINSYRIKEFKQRVASSQLQKFSLLGLAYDCGFNSKSTFNTVFKKHVQMTPSQYVKSIKNTSS